ncbi:hypothetical protein SLS62_000500 [Diatrype stigma]|uniref:Uncharacterized protein n=1 Tax=Diatrype stigma TaxID=117547 RepID=A0AAN9UXQ1_9PEZI
MSIESRQQAKKKRKAERMDSDLDVAEAAPSRILRDRDRKKPTRYIQFKVARMALIDPSDTGTKDKDKDGKTG